MSCATSASTDVPSVVAIALSDGVRTVGLGVDGEGRQRFEIDVADRGRPM